MADEIILVQDKDGEWRVKQEPYAVIECMTKEDYDTFVRLLKRGRDSEWIDPAVELPADPEENVLILVSGSYGCITFKRAYELATYNSDDGWILDAYPEWENPHVLYWTPLPDMPEESEKNGG